MGKNANWACVGDKLHLLRRCLDFCDWQHSWSQQIIWLEAMIFYRQTTEIKKSQSKLKKINKRKNCRCHMMGKSTFLHRIFEKHWSCHLRVCPWTFIRDLIFRANRSFYFPHHAGCLEPRRKANLTSQMLSLVRACTPLLFLPDSRQLPKK